MSSSNFSRYFEAVQFLESLINIKIADYMSTAGDKSFFLNRTKYLLKTLGSPEKGFEYIHVTGTSGKGSTCTNIQAILSAAGYQTGMYTSPFATTTIERIQVNDLYIAPDEFADIVEGIKPKLNEIYLTSPYGFPSYSEIFFAIALLYFKQKKCTHVVVEVGCGGKNDHTNVIPAPLVAVITNIGKDHVKILGKTLTKIAREKAGIVKNKTHLITGETRPHLLKIIKDICRKNHATMESVTPNNSTSANDNIARAIAKHLKIKEQAITQGLKKSFIPIRLETVRKKPLVILDGAHNEDKMKYLVRYLKTLSYKKMHLVFGLKASKDAEPILKQILPLADRLYLTRFRQFGLEPFDLKELSILCNRVKPTLKTQVYLDSFIALRDALKHAGPNDLVLTTGSIYMVGDLRRIFVPEEKVLKQRHS